VLFRRSYIAPLVTDPIGWVLTVYALASVAFGAFVMNRLCKLEV
jgi:Flp pilus assembly protein TadB